MFRLLVVISLVLLLYFLVRKLVRGVTRPPLDGAAGDVKAMIQDPVCRVYIPKGTAVAQSIGGQTYYFCSVQCARTFQKQLAG